MPSASGAPRVSGQGQGAAVTGGAEGGAAHAGQEIEVIARVDGECGPVPGIEACIFGIARGAHAGFAAKGIDFEAGIVGEDRSGGEAAVVLRLETGIAGEGRLILGGGGDFCRGRATASTVNPPSAAATEKSRSLPGLVVAA